MITPKILMLIATMLVSLPALQLAQAARGQASKAVFKAGQTLKECRNCPDMVVVPAGTFAMGSPADEPERRENEPQHRITIARPWSVIS